MMTRIAMHGIWAIVPEIYPLPGFYEPFSAISHLLGAVLFLYLGTLLIRRGRGNRNRLIFLGIYIFSCVLLFSMSGVYHMMIRGENARIVLARLDHGAIFMLIAGTSTPLHGILFHGWLRWVPLVLVWVAAITSITLKTIFFDDMAEFAGLILYFTLGLFGGMAAIILARRYGFAFVKPLLWGGAAYIVGGTAEFLGVLVVIPGVIHPHEVFHLSVLFGAFCHWLFIWQIAAGPPHARRDVIQ